MPTKIEKDALTGRETTGHEWDGLKELNTPLPKWWLYTFFVCCIVAFIMFALLPSIPYGPGYFRGLLGASSRDRVAEDVAAMTEQRAVFMDKIRSLPIEQVKNDPQLLAVATTAGRITFATNCQPCHGAGGEGQVGYPSLADDTWLWGGKLADIQQTITHGIRSGDENARNSVMPAFGSMLKPDQIGAIADFVASEFFGAGEGGEIAKGKALYAENCAVCHGANGEGSRMMGAPPLKSAVHLFAGTREAVVAQVTSPKMGVMPNWNTRLDEATIKSVAIYVHALGGGE
ncbi:Cbb3-type cytochrome c oxidase subunit CcoP [Rhodovastum atsumiense]|uniref:Cbb3-type cytochrome c oxidase subunit n=1 Tax=Rhodovastum atsumiense TaxID=504468 RepID=A0A5M6J3F0_9PROT|nr:cytochrome-c oxidase, cbb3-type subunit III [Rhodovastum atsumiense]KAA5614749.1 cytochrome-c oxidase, cbb3-type subunit III [Rhodovastum atsumiense]CAH2599704.1 Cbb3-type cytochrome c oxidase subunit CcoP [Rhodovastum atsumiense]